MMRILLTLFVFTFLFSCKKEKILQLPKISYSKITNIKDVSHAYLFYDDTQADHVSLNRKNLISTTNWLINVDKRLSLKQAIPHIKYLQDKKSNSSHKNKNAKNYFTCNNVSITNLGFVEFTNISYHNESSLTNYLSMLSGLKKSSLTSITFNKNNDIIITSPLLKPKTTKINTDLLPSYLKKCDSSNSSILLKFNGNLSFQNYIDYSSVINKTELKHSKILNKYFIFN